MKCLAGVKTWNLKSNRKSLEDELSGSERHNRDF